MDTTILQSNSAVQLIEQQGAVVVCEQGQLWLTDNGDDIVLERGECHQIQSMSAVVIEALGATCHYHIDGVMAPHAHWLKKFPHALRETLHNRHLPHAHA